MSWGEILFIIFVPPIMTVAWAVVSRLWAIEVFGISGKPVSERTKRRQRKELPWVLAMLYVVLIVAAIHKHWH